MNFDSVLTQVIILFSVLLVGFIIKRRNMQDKAVDKSFTDFLMNVTIPFTIISSFNQNHGGDALYNGLLVFIISFGIHLFCVLFGMLLHFKIETGARRVLWFLAVFSNSGFYGYPILESIYGKIGVLYGSIYNIPFALFVWTFGQMLFTGKKDLKSLKNALLNPAMIAVMLGLILFVSPFRLPGLITEFVDLIGSMTTPLSMIIVGSMLAEIKLKEILTGFYIYYNAAVRLVIVPLIVFLALTVLGVNTEVLGVCVILAATPAAVIGVMFAEQYNGDVQLASRCVFFSTALSIITIPVWLLVL